MKQIKSTMIKILSTIALLLLLVVWSDGGDILTVNAASLSADSITVQEKLDLLLQKLGPNSYFTVNRAACEPSREGGHLCDNCYVSYIVETGWFKSLFGDIEVTKFPSHDYSATGRDYRGYSCFGFACFAQWYVFADSRDEELMGQRVATISFNKNEIMNNVKAGDVLRVNGHSIVVYSVEETGIYAVDSNWNMGGQLNCVVQKHFIPYTAGACAGYTTYVNRVTKTANMASGMAGMFDVDGSSTTQPGKIYGTLDLSATSWSSYNVGLNADFYADKAYTIYHGAMLEILKKTTNSQGIEVYHVYSPDLGMNCYVSAKYVKIIESNPTVEDGVTSFVNRMYNLILEREPDAGGATWISGLKNGTYTGVSVAEGFIMSNEFLNKNISNEEFVKIMYRAFFGREADSSGLATWKGSLDEGYMKKFVFAGFANSDEFKALCDTYGIECGVINLTLAEKTPNLSEQDFNIWQFVERLYSEVMGRNPDQTGMDTWVGVLKAGTYTGAQVAEGFILSNEFLNKDMTNDEFVKIMYRAFFNRDADSAGFETWTNALETGWTKEAVFAGFANSDEFGRICDEYGIIQGSVTAE